MEILKYFLPAVAIYAIVKPQNTQEQGSGAKIGAASIEDEVTEMTPFFDVYKTLPRDGKAGKFADELQAAKKRAGVYAIQENGRIVYIGSSKTQLYKTITRHFHYWKHESRQVTYDATTARYKVAIFYIRPEAASFLECEYITEAEPRDNQNKCLSHWLTSYEEFKEAEKERQRASNEVPF